MKGYWIALYKKIGDMDNLKNYAAKVTPVIKSYGGKPLGGIVDSHNDHRIAMAMATLGLKASGDIQILNSECVDKSYPKYFEDFAKLTINIFLLLAFFFPFQMLFCSLSIPVLFGIF